MSRAAARVSSPAGPVYSGVMKNLPDLSHLAHPGTEIPVHVIAPPEDGKANEAVRKLVAKALGVAKTRLTLIRGTTARDKTFRIG